jgi:2-keto-4-pentenoate hydratase/2-oxohepta-3-ene-1,7-dioic acid hydratase in catechol pathway
MRNVIPGLANLPIGSIYCVGRNYAAHIAELQNDTPDKPIIFTKPYSSVIFDGEAILIPPQSNDVHHEAELVIAIGKAGKNISPEKAADFIAGIGIGIDVTARDIQNELKDKGLPWDLAKGMDTFTVLGSFKPFSSDIVFSELDINLNLNNENRQAATADLMLFPIPTLISFISKYMTLLPGDVIFTGTPKGVSKISANDIIRVWSNKLDISLSVSVQNA